MRLVLYLGTRACPTLLEEALSGYHDDLGVLVPSDPRLLGPVLEGPELEAGFADIARILLDRALAHGRAIAEREDATLSDVFGQAPPDPSQRVTGRVLDGRIEEGLATFVDAHDVDRCYVARDALDVLDGVSIRPADALEPHGVEMVAR